MGGSVDRRGGIGSGVRMLSNGVSQQPESDTVYAIFEDSGRQYKVSTGDKIFVDVRDVDDDQETLEFDRVLAVGEGADSRIGQPYIEGVKVIGHLDGRVKGPKLTIMKFRRRKDSQTKTGHRQKHLQVTIGEIVG